MRLNLTLLACWVGVVLGTEASHAQTATSSDQLWQTVDAPEQAKGVVDPWSGIRSYKLARLEQVGLQNTLAKAPAEAAVRASASPAVITVPMPDGTFQQFRYVESPVMAPELAAKYPEIKTYLGQGIDDPHATVRFDWTPQGFHAFVLSPSGSVIVDPYIKGQTDQYISYYRRDVSPEAAAWTCYTDDNNGNGALKTFSGPQALSSGNQLLTYHIAVAATGEYTAYHGGTVALGLAAVVTAVNRISGIFEQEFCIRLQLVANNNLIVYTNSNTDPYTGNNNSTMLDENQANLDSVIGSANYDVGHVFSTAGGGVAYVGFVCWDGMKAKGASGLSSPVGDGFAVEIAAHEMGHQFGSHHTWNGTLGSCSADQWGSDSACEPGSGSTIMGYAGLCGADNLQGARDYYYHAISYQRIRNYCTTLTGANCPTLSNTGNQAPIVDAGLSYTIPQETPFVLTATGSDPDSDPITYCWEEVDVGPQAPLSAGDNGTSPIFRSWPPNAIPVRYFPRLSNLLANTLPTGEHLPASNRTLLMRCTVRDNQAGGGGVATDDTTLTVTTTAGPFTITSPNTAVSWSGTRTVAWNVANTHIAPVSCSLVNIRLSTDGGNTWPVLLAGNTPNDGGQSVTIPNTPTSQARIKVEAVGNIFFDISDVDFGITGPPTNVVASDGTFESVVRITWDGPVGFSYYQVYRNTTNNSAGATAISSWQTPEAYNDTGITPGATYYYWVKAATSSGGANATGFSASDSGWAALPAPASVSASDGTYTDRVEVTTSAVAGASYYRLYHGVSSNSSLATTVGNWQTSTTFSDTTVIAGRTYYFWTKAATGSNGEGASGLSPVDAGWRKLSPPANVAATDGTDDTRVLITWDSVTGATYYRVYRNTTDDFGTAIAQGAWQSSTSYSDYAAYGVDFYYWAVAAVDSSGTRPSDPGTSDVGWRGMPPPTNVAASDGEYTAHVRVTWDLSAGGSWYRVYRNIVSTPSHATAVSGWLNGATSYDDTGATAGQTYYYWVKVSSDDVGTHVATSASDTGWRALTGPNATASDGLYVDRVAVSWSSPPGSPYYYCVYRSTKSNPLMATAVSGWQTGASFSDTTASPGQVYYYWVRAAIDDAGTRASDVGRSNTGWRAKDCNNNGIPDQNDPDEDDDGIPDDCDLCPGTAPGAPVDVNGCPRFVAQWRSVRSHASVGDLSIVLDADATGNGITGPTAETRAGGIQRIEADFDRALTSLGNVAAITVVSGTNSYAPATVSLANGNVTLVLTFAAAPDAGSLPDGQCYTINIGTGAISPNLSGDADVSIRALAGDSTMNGQINLGDALYVKSRMGQALDSSTAQFDVDLSGEIGLSDVAWVKNRITSPALQVVCSSAAAPLITQWRSVRSHAGVGDLPIVLNANAMGDGITGPTVETRAGGIQRIEVDFDSALTSVANAAAISVTSGAGSHTPATVSLANGNMTLVLTFPAAPTAGHLPDEQCYTISIGAGALLPNPTGDTDVNIRALAGDTTMNGQINLGDALYVRSRLGQAVDATTDQFDVDLSGEIGLSDVAWAKARIASPAVQVVCP